MQSGGLQPQATRTHTHTHTHAGARNSAYRSSGISVRSISCCAPQTRSSMFGKVVKIPPIVHEGGEGFQGRRFGSKSLSAVGVRSEGRSVARTSLRRCCCCASKASLPSPRRAAACQRRIHCSKTFNASLKEHVNKNERVSHSHSYKTPEADAVSLI